MNQTTIASSVSISGVGLHTGVDVNLTLRPAPENTGYIFVRTDLDDFEIPASVEYVSHCSYATTLMRRGVVLSTCEHLLSALRGSGIDNCFIDLDNIEVPICDGSSENFLDLIKKAGVAEQESPRKTLVIKKRVDVDQDGRRCPSNPPMILPSIASSISRIRLSTGRRTALSSLTAHSPGRSDQRAYVWIYSRDRDAAKGEPRARRFTGERHRSHRRRHAERDAAPLPDEFVRHKILDIIGDIALLGMPLRGRITAEKSGHSVHAQLMSKLLKDESAWEIV